MAWVRLPDQKLAHPEHHRRALGLFALHGHEAHRRTQRSLADGLSISCIVFLTLHEGIDVSWRDEPHLMTQLANLAAPEMRAAAGLHGDDTGGQLAEKRQHLIPPPLLAKHRTT